MGLPVLVMELIGLYLVRDCMYLAVAGACAEQEANASSPLSVSISNNNGYGVGVVIDTLGSSISAPGDINFSATASGGSGSYTYTWSITEISDPDGVYAVGSQGTTSNVDYNDATISTTYSNPPPPAPPNPPPAQGTYRVECEVDDGVTTATDSVDITVDAF